MYCRKCGAQNEDESKYCCESGEKLTNDIFTEVLHNSGIEEEPQIVNNVPANQNKGYASISMTLGVLAIVLCCISPLFGVPAIICGYLSIKNNEPETGKAYLWLLSKLFQ